MTERSQQYFSEIGENFDLLRESIRGLSLYVSELEELIEEYRQYVSNQGKEPELPHMAVGYRLLQRTEAVMGPAPSPEPPSMAEASRKASHRAKIAPAMGL